MILECSNHHRGVETMHMIKKGQMDCPKGETLSEAQQFYSLTV